MWNFQFKDYQSPIFKMLYFLSSPISNMILVKKEFSKVVYFLK